MSNDERSDLRPFQQFAESSSLGGVLLLSSAVAALVWANSPWRDSYFALWQHRIAVGPEGSPLVLTIHHWINDGLMAVFFLLVGLEIKREALVGELSSLRQAALPMIAALGGMIVPAGIYGLVTMGTSGAHGWGIPMATDIAFALGILQLLGRRCPFGLKVFLTALAIADDMGGILVIAVFYTAAIDATALGLAAGVLALMVVLNRLRVRSLAPYLLLGLGLWYLMHASGIHATIAGVLLAWVLPVHTRIDAAEFSRRARGLIDEFDRAETGDLLVITSKGQQEAIHALESASEAVQAPILRLEHALHGIVAFGVMPVFALANAGLAIGAAPWPWESRVGAGVCLGLLVGKPLGIMLFALLAVRGGLAGLPRATSWRHLHGAAWLAGIGFTVSLFIAQLSLPDARQLAAAKLGVLLASLGAGILGYAVLRRVPGPPG